MSYLYRLKKNINRLIAVLLLIISIAGAAHAIDTEDRQHDEQHCAICLSLHYSTSGVVSASVTVPPPPGKARPVDVFDRQFQKSVTIIHFGARAPPLE